MQAGGVQFNLQAVAEAHEGIAREAFTPFHALEQEAGSERRKFHEGGDRRVQVSGNIERRFHVNPGFKSCRQQKTHPGAFPEMGSGDARVF
jgi:hypothetical protein